jgi:hypothetical protein
MAAEGWKPEWWQLSQLVVRYGLPVHVLGVTRLDDLIVLELDANEAVLPRTHAQRGFPLHISLLFQEELRDDEQVEQLRRLHARWTGRHVLLPVQWVGSGGAAMLAPGRLAADPDLLALHAAGWYSWRQIHVSL